MLVLLFAGERVAGRGFAYDFATGLGLAAMAMFAAPARPPQARQCEGSERRTRAIEGATEGRVR
jgi:hypothetical protein